MRRDANQLKLVREMEAVANGYEKDLEGRDQIGGPAGRWGGEGRWDHTHRGSTGVYCPSPSYASRLAVMTSSRCTPPLPIRAKAGYMVPVQSTWRSYRQRMLSAS